MVLSDVDQVDQVSELIHRIQNYVSPRRIRMKEFYCNFDELNSGRCTKAQFGRAIDTAGFRIADWEVDALVEHFTENGPHVQKPQVVNYSKFCDAIEQVFKVDVSIGSTVDDGFGSPYGSPNNSMGMVSTMTSTMLAPKPVADEESAPQEPGPVHYGERSALRLAASSTRDGRKVEAAASLEFREALGASRRGPLLASMIEVLRGLASPGARDRDHATAMYNQAKKANPDELVMTLVKVVATSRQHSDRLIALVYARQLMNPHTAGDQFVFDKLQPANKQRVAQALSELFAKETSESIKSKIGELTKMAETRGEVLEHLAKASGNRNIFEMKELGLRRHRVAKDVIHHAVKTRHIDGLKEAIRGGQRAALPEHDLELAKKTLEEEERKVSATAALEAATAAKSIPDLRLAITEGEKAVMGSKELMEAKTVLEEVLEEQEIFASDIESFDEQQAAPMEVEEEEPEEPQAGLTPFQTSPSLAAPLQTAPSLAAQPVSQNEGMPDVRSPMPQNGDMPDIERAPPSQNDRVPDFRRPTSQNDGTCDLQEAPEIPPLPHLPSSLADDDDDFFGDDGDSVAAEPSNGSAAPQLEGCRSLGENCHIGRELSYGQISEYCAELKAENTLLKRQLAEKDLQEVEAKRRRCEESLFGLGIML